MELDICIGLLLARFDEKENQEGGIRNFLKEMLYDAIRETVHEGEDYDEGLDVSIDYDSINEVTIIILHILPDSFFQRRFRSKKYSKKFYEKYQ